MNDKFEITVRLSEADAHYGGGLVAGAKVLELFGDAVTGLCCSEVGDEGLLSSWHDVHFVAPCYPGDFLRVVAHITKKTKLRRFISVEAFKIIDSSRARSSSSVTSLLVEPKKIAFGDSVLVLPVSAVRGLHAHTA